MDDCGKGKQPPHGNGLPPPTDSSYYYKAGDPNAPIPQGSIADVNSRFSPMGSPQHYGQPRTAAEEGRALKSRVQPKPRAPKVESKHPLDKTTNIDPEAYDVIFDADKEDTDPKIPNYDPSKGEQRFAEYNSQAETNEE